MKILAAIGFVILSFGVVGVVKTGTGVIKGTDSPADVVRNINKEYTEGGLVIPAPDSDAGRYDTRRDAPAAGDSARRSQETARER